MRGAGPTVDAELPPSGRKVGREKGHTYSDPETEQTKTSPSNRMSGVPSSTPRLKQWMIEQVDSERYPGLVWEDRNLGMFRIPWKHANHQDYRHDKDAAIFEVRPTPPPSPTQQQ
ncbi:interferon regulatory factor 4-like [Chiloscyllium plagiosum]|uniref:interferon regulatory factor 4-like n=1 Tax=Chiloscyllium plagiosum TaxID=36176 RepID=UPI001CB7CBFE|nr:interferon regulatory factor 4-like [Chiloscyllium plagiosum]